MSSPVQSGDEDYEFIPDRESPANEQARQDDQTAFIAYVGFVVAFLIVIAVVIFALWRSGRCRSKCDEETGNSKNHSGINSRNNSRNSSRINSRNNSKNNSRCGSNASLSAAASVKNGFHIYGERLDIPHHMAAIVAKETHAHSLASKVVLEVGDPSSATHGQCGGKKGRNDGVNSRRENFHRAQSMNSSATPPTPPPSTPPTIPTTRVGGLPRRSSFGDLTSLGRNVT